MCGGWFLNVMWSLEIYSWKGIWELSVWKILCCLGSLGSDRKNLIFKRLPAKFRQFVVLFGSEQQISSYYFSRINKEKWAATSMTKNQLRNNPKSAEWYLQARERIELFYKRTINSYIVYPSYLGCYKSSQVILRLILTNCVFFVE